MYNLNQFNENITNLYSEFVHKNNSKCHNGGDSNCSLKEGLLKIIQAITQQPFSFIAEKDRNSPFSPALEAHFLPYLNKEEMSRQEKLTALLKHLATTPNGDMYMQFVLELAKESVTAETLQNLIRSGNVNTPPTYNGDIGKTENSPCEKDESAESNIITFTKNEVKRMDKTFKKHFILNGYIAHVIKRKTVKTVFTTKYVIAETDIISAPRPLISTRQNVSF